MPATFSAVDRRLMRRALGLAARGLGLTSPNPAVGAVLARGSRVIGEGFHRKAGQPHAEVEAVRDAKKKGNKIAGATLYVTLEPCSTCGRTPACTDLIRREKIARVVVAATDPNPHHAGAGFGILRKAGVDVAPGLLAGESAALNRAFNHWIVTRRPWVVAKIALGLDGTISPRQDDDRWLTSAAARTVAHELRWEADAILVGGETARTDDPQLTVRLPGRKGKIQPLRLVWSRSKKFSPALRLFSDRHRARTRIVSGPLPKIVADLGKENVTRLLLEGGGEVIGAAFEVGIVNEVAFFLAPVALGTERAALAGTGTPRTLALRETVFRRLGPDLFCRALL